MRIVADKKTTAAMVLEKLRRGKLTGGKYIRTDKLPVGVGGSNVEAARPINTRCAIGWLMSREEAIAIEARTSKVCGDTNYPLVRDLLDVGALVVDDDWWFRDLQGHVDSWGGPERDKVAPRRRQAIVDHCNAALAE